MNVYLPVGVVFLAVAVVFMHKPVQVGDADTAENRRLYPYAAGMLALAGIANIALGLWQMWRGD